MGCSMIDTENAFKVKSQKVVKFFKDCFPVKTHYASKYGLSTQKNDYTNPAKFNGVYALAKSTGWEYETTAVVFDFIGDDINFEPRVGRFTKDENWIDITNWKQLQEIMKNVGGFEIRAVTVRPCADCERKAAGAVISDAAITFDYDDCLKTAYFRRGADLMASGDDVAGGGDGGGGCG